MRKPIVKTRDYRQRTRRTATGALFEAVQRKVNWSQKRLAEELGESGPEICKYAVGTLIWSGKGVKRRQLISKPRLATAVEWDKRHEEFGLSPHAFFAATCETLGEELTGTPLAVAVSDLVPRARACALATSPDNDRTGGGSLPGSVAELARECNEFTAIQVEGAEIDYRLVVWDCRLRRLDLLAKATRRLLLTFAREELSALMSHLNAETDALDREIDLLNDALDRRAARLLSG